MARAGGAAIAAAGSEVRVFVRLDDYVQLGLDCVAMVGPGRGLAYGWAMAPRGIDTELLVDAGADGVCAVAYCGFHPRNDVVPADPRVAMVSGFTLAFETPEEPRELALTLTLADGRAVRIDLFDPRIGTDLGKATANRAWPVTHGLMQACAGTPALAALLRHQGRPFGIFAEWMARLPLLRGRMADQGRFAELEAVSTSAGEVLVMLRAAAALPPEATLSATAIAWLRGEPDAPPEPLLVPFADWHAARLPAALAGYGRLDPGLLDRLQAIELVVHVQPQPGEDAWLRCEPTAGTVPDLLDAAGRTLAGSVALPVEAAATAGLDLLRQIAARREAAFGPTLAALAVPAPAEGVHHLPRLALILGADDPAAGRLFHVTADAFERRCDTVLVMGAAADDVAQALARRGRLRVLVGVEAAQALREAAGRAGIIAIEAAAFAEAVIAGTPEDAFARPLEAADVARLLALHAAAGCAPALGDSLQRLLRARRDPGAHFAPVQRPWRNRHAAEAAQAHLQRLWSAGGAAPLPEPATHG